MNLQKCGICGKEIGLNHPCMGHPEAGIICMRCEGLAPPKKIYYKVYQDRKNCSDNDAFYVDTLEGVESCLEDWKKEVEENEEINFPIIEPVLMTEYRFKNLPDFEGF